MQNKRYQFLIVGSGFYGSTMARKLTDAGKTCLVIDKNPHVAGAAHDFRWSNGQLVASYGAHCFHTHSEEVWSFITQFCSMDLFINKPKVLTGGKVYSFPINLMTLQQLWGVVTPSDARKKLDSVRIPCSNPRNFEEWVLDKIGRELYDLFIYSYTKKQYCKEPSLLPSSIIQRLPIRLTYDESYFTTKYQSMPKEGYTALIENMLTGIDVELGLDFFEIGDWHNYADFLIYTGPLDKFFDYSFGKLDYNTLRFEHKEFYGDYQGNAVFNHTDSSVPYLRSVEHKHFVRSYQKHYDPLHKNKDLTVVSFDHPVPFAEHPEPYYPIRDTKNSVLHDKYLGLLKNVPDVAIGGRISGYQYFDLDQAISAAFVKSKKILDIK